SDSLNAVPLLSMGSETSAKPSSDVSTTPAPIGTLMAHAPRTIDAASRRAGTRGRCPKRGARRSSPALAAELVRPAALETLLVSRSRMHGGKVARQVRVALEPTARVGRFEHEDELDIGAGQLVADEEVFCADLAFHVAQMIGHFALDPWPERSARIAQ